MLSHTPHPRSRGAVCGLLVAALALASSSFGALLAQEAGGEAKPEAKAKVAKAAEKDEAKPIVALVGATVHPVDAPMIPSGTVLVQDGKILGVGRALPIPSGATVIDCDGKHIVPGFIALSSRGIMGFRGASRRESAKDRFDPYSDLMLFALSSGITTAHEAGGGGGFASFFGGAGGDVFRGSDKGRMGGTVAKLTYGSIDGYELKDPAGIYFQYPKNSSTARATLEDALEKGAKHSKEQLAYMKALVEWAGKKESDRGAAPQAPKADDVTQAIARAIDGEIPAFIEANRRIEIETVLDLVDRFGVPFIITGAQEAWTLPVEIGRRPVRIAISPRGTGGRAARPYRNRFKQAPHGWSIETAAKLEQVGVRFATLSMGSGISVGGLAGRDLAALPLDAGFAIRGGASEAEALRSITLTPAEMLGIDDRVGSIAVGKDADLLLMDREPLDYRSLVDKAWVNGREVYDRQEVGLWAHLRTDRSSGLGDWRPWGIWGELPERAPEKAATSSPSGASSDG